MNSSDWTNQNQYEFPPIAAIDLQDFQRHEFPQKVLLANLILFWASSAGLPMSRLEFDFEDGFLNFTWREPQFDLFLHTSDDGEMFGYYRQRMVDGKELDDPGSDLNSQFDVRVCVETIGMNFMPTPIEKQQDPDLDLAS